MLTKLIVALYVWLLEIALWLTLPLAGVWGYHVTVPIMNDAGAVLTNEFAWRICGALVFPILAFLVLAVITGPFLILVDVRNGPVITAKTKRSEEHTSELQSRLHLVCRL